MARVAVGSLVSPAARARLEAGAATSWPSRAPVPLTRALYDLWALVGYRDADGARVLDHALLSARATRRRRLVSALEALSGASVGLYAVTSRRAGWVALRELETAAALDAMTAPGGGAEEPEPGDLVLGWLVKLGRRAAVLAAWHVIGRDVAGPVLEALAAGRDAAQAWRPELSAEACAAMALPLAVGEAAGAEELAWWDVDELGDGVELGAICLEALATSWQLTRDPGAPGF